MTPTDVTTLLHRFTQRYRTALLAKTLILVGLGLACSSVLAWRLAPLHLAPVWRVGVPAALAAATGAGVGWWGYRHWPSRRASAAYLDRLLGLKQRLITAEEFATASIPPALYPALVADASQWVVDARTRYPRPLDRAAATLAALLLLILAWPLHGRSPLQQLAQLPKPLPTPRPPQPQSTPPPPPPPQQQRQQSGSGQQQQSSAPSASSSSGSQGQSPSGQNQQQQTGGGSSSQSGGQQNSSGSGKQGAGQSSAGSTDRSAGGQSGQSQSGQGQGQQRSDGGSQKQAGGVQQSGQGSSGSPQPSPSSQSGQSSSSGGSQSASGSAQGRGQGRQTAQQAGSAGGGQSTEQAHAGAGGNQSSEAQAARAQAGGGSSSGSPGNEALQQEIQQLLKEVSGEIRTLQAQIATAKGQPPPTAGTTTDPELYGTSEPLGQVGDGTVPIQLKTDTAAATSAARAGNGVGRPSGEVSTANPTAKAEPAQLSDEPLEEPPGSRETVPPEYRDVFDRLNRRPSQP